MGKRLFVLLAISLLFVASASSSEEANRGAEFRLRDSVIRFFSTSDASPLIFLGKVIEGDLGPRPCRIGSERWITFSVAEVLFGFPPGDRVRVLYSNCGSVAPRLATGENFLVFAVQGYSDGTSRAAFLQPATAENQRIARAIARSYLDHQIVGFKSHHTNWDKLVFVGSVTDLWPKPKSQAVPPVCKQALPFPVSFKLDQLVFGSWPDRQVTVVFNGCNPPPDPPIRVDRRMIVFAGVARNREVYGYLQWVLPVSEIERVRAHFQSSSP
jgi:hypothetical protein